MKADSPSRRMISPVSPACPTRTTSYMRAPFIPRATTMGPVMRAMDPRTLVFRFSVSVFIVVC
jgi:hypothetical protein